MASYLNTTIIFMMASNNLSLEQQFTLMTYKYRMKKFSLYESKQYLKVTLHYMLIKDNLIKFLVQNKKF
nr:phycobilisome degradation protein [Thorea hispida]